MLVSIVNYITDSSKTAFTSVGAAIFGQIANDDVSNLTLTNIGLQHAAWTIAILTGLLSIINLFFPLRTFYIEYKRKRHEKYLNETNTDTQQQQ